MCGLGAGLWRGRDPTSGRCVLLEVRRLWVGGDPSCVLGVSKLYRFGGWPGWPFLRRLSLFPLFGYFLVNENDLCRAGDGASAANRIDKGLHLVDRRAFFGLVEDQVFFVVHVFAVNVWDDCVLLSQFRRVGCGHEYTYVFADGSSGRPVVNIFDFANRDSMLSQFYFGVLAFVPICYCVFGGLGNVRVTFVALQGVNDRLW